MPRLVNEIKPLLDQVFLDVQSAWPECTVYKGAPRTDVSTPFATVAMDSIGNSFNAVREIGMAVTVRVFGFFPLPVSQNVEDAKLEKADHLISVLEAHETYYDLANLPLVSEVNLPDINEQDQYQVEITFTCTSFGKWGNDEDA
jgi:hypothetical protein